MDSTSSEAGSKTVFIFEGIFSPESVDDKIVALGHRFKKKALRAIAHEWLETENELKQLNIAENLLVVLIFLSRETLLEACNDRYFEQWPNLLEEIKKYPALIFVDENNLMESSFDFDLDKKCSEILLNIQSLMNNLKITIFSVDLIKIDLEKIYELIIHFNDELFKNVVMENYQIVKDFNDNVKSKINDWYTINNIISPEKEGGERSLLNDWYTINNIISPEKEGGERFINLRNYIMFMLERAKNIKVEIEKFRENYRIELAEDLQRAQQLLKSIETSGVELAPYKSKTDISLRVHHFLDEIDRGIFLHLYVPNGRYQEDQLASFLRLFESYLQRVEKLEISIDTRKTSHGQLYEFKSKSNLLNLTDMEVGLSRFEDFMSLCQNDFKSAEALLLRTGISSVEANQLLIKYTKQYRRLLFDSEQERKNKIFHLQQQLESEAFELTNAADLAVSQSVQPTALLSLPNNFDLINIAITNSSVIINSGIQSIIEQAIYGDIHYTIEDKQLIQLFEKYTERLEAISMRSELEQLKDTSSPEIERKTAKQKIVGFLSKVAPAIGQSALTVLTAYLEKVLTGS